MRTLKNIVLSPFFLSFFPFFIIVLLVPFNFKKYIVESESHIILASEFYVWYVDLNNDGNSERITAFNQDNTTGISIYNENGIIDQWNFRGKFDFSSQKCLFITGDKDNNGTKEIYVFTLNGDTILLHCIANLRDPSLEIKNRVIAIAGKGIKNPDPFIIQSEMYDLDSDGVKELIFGIGSGFSFYPRNVFAYFIAKDSLVKSPESSYYIDKILQADVNNDGKKEIIPSGYASGNIRPELSKYHDFSSFLMILDQNLKFLFDPLEFRGKYSALTPALWNSDNDLSLVWLYHSASVNTPSTFYFVNSSRKISDSVPLTFFAQNCFKTKAINNENQLLVSLKNGLGLLNEKFELIKIVKNKCPFGIIQDDFDQDGKIEILVPDTEKGQIFIYREGLTQPVSANVTLSSAFDDHISLKINNKSYPLISVQSGQNQAMLKYGINPAYPYYYLYFPGIYLAILAFALSINHIQKKQLRKKYETEKKISELQLALIRNQLDPHFILNVINSIIYSIEYADKEQASEQLRKFANLFRNMLMSAGSTRTTIAEELDFCNDYLHLEKMRFNESFNFTISVSDDVNRNLLIPKLLIQIHAENAVKHGLSSLETGRNLNIDLRNADGALLIDITDNGIGRKKAGNLSVNSTGKGLEIMEELYSIYNRYYKEKVSSEIIDLYDSNGMPAGTKVSIRILKQYEKNRT